MQDIDRKLTVSMREAVDRAEKITVATHLHPDGDAIGSSVGLLCYLKSLGKDACIVLDDKYPESLGFIARKAGKDILVYEENPSETMEAISRSDLVVIGNEGHGISAGVASLCRALSIPTDERSESLNAAVAASVILWEAAAHG